MNHYGKGFHHCNFLTTVDAVEGTTTGISAYDRAKTISILSDLDAKSSDLSSPGHMFPLAAVRGGVLERQGHTEAIVDLCALAGLKKAGVICEILNEDGTMARRDDLIRFACKHKLKMLTVRDIVEYIKQRSCIEFLNSTELPTKYGNFRMRLYKCVSDSSASHPFALIKGTVSSVDPVLVRIHSECLTGDLLGSQRCDCGAQLTTALKSIESEGRGILIYLRQTGRGIGLLQKLAAYNLQHENRMETNDANLALGYRADEWNYREAAEILQEMGVNRVRLMTNNPEKLIQMKQFGIDVTERVPIVTGINSMNHIYRNKQRMEHLYDIERGKKQ